jgi:gentisate 1,2-dioxygenase
VPTWTKFEHRASSDTQLFCMSDEALMKSSRFYKFEAD